MYTIFTKIHVLCMYILSKVELTGFLFYFVLFNPFTAPCTQQLLKDISRATTQHYSQMT